MGARVRAWTAGCQKKRQKQSVVTCSPPSRLEHRAQSRSRVRPSPRLHRRTPPRMASRRRRLHIANHEGLSESLWRARTTTSLFATLKRGTVCPALSTACPIRRAPSPPLCAFCGCGMQHQLVLSESPPVATGAAGQPPNLSSPGASLSPIHTITTGHRNLWAQTTPISLFPLAPSAAPEIGDCYLMPAMFCGSRLNASNGAPGSVLGWRGSRLLPYCPRDHKKTSSTSCICKGARAVSERVGGDNDQNAIRRHGRGARFQLSRSYNVGTKGAMRTAASPAIRGRQLNGTCNHDPSMKPMTLHRKKSLQCIARRRGNMLLRLSVDGANQCSALRLRSLVPEGRARGHTPPAPAVRLLRSPAARVAGGTGAKERKRAAAGRHRLVPPHREAKGAPQFLTRVGSWPTCEGRAPRADLCFDCCDQTPIRAQCTVLPSGTAAVLYF